jgi:malonyl CoA-acyl carrier protein transacylase
MSIKDETYLLHFGGLGNPWFREIKGLYRDPGLQDSFLHLFNILDQEKALIGGTPALPQGLDLREWLVNGKVTPGGDYAYKAAVCIPMVFAAQAFQFRLLAQKMGSAFLAKHVKAAWGHSLGILAGAFASVLLRGGDWDLHFRSFIRYLLHFGIRSDEFILRAAPWRESQADEDASPMASLVGCDTEAAREIAAAANLGRMETDRIHIGLLNLSRNTVLCGSPSSLSRLRADREASFDGMGIKFSYVRTSCPFHSPLMAGMIPVFEKDIAAFGFAYPGDALGIPVYSGHDGRDLRGDADLGQSVLQEWCVRSIDWRGTSARILREHPHSTILDFGPGSGSRALLADLQRELAEEGAPAMPSIMDNRILEPQANGVK